LRAASASVGFVKIEVFLDSPASILEDSPRIWKQRTVFCTVYDVPWNTFPPGRPTGETGLAATDPQLKLTGGLADTNRWRTPH
jgi:hypothetical protein